MTMCLNLVFAYTVIRCLNGHPCLPEQCRLSFYTEQQKKFFLRLKYQMWFCHQFYVANKTVRELDIFCLHLLLPVFSHILNSLNFIVHKLNTISSGLSLWGSIFRGSVLWELNCLW